MVTAEFLYLAAANAGLLIPARLGAMEVQVDFRAPDEEVLGGMGLSRAYVMRYPRVWWPDLTVGTVIDIAGDAYRVQELRQISDGTEMQANLAKV